MSSSILKAMSWVGSLTYRGVSSQLTPLNAKGALFSSKQAQAVALDLTALAVGSLSARCANLYLTYRTEGKDQATTKAKGLQSRLVGSVAVASAMAEIANRVFTGKVFHKYVMPQFYKACDALQQDSDRTAQKLGGTLLDLMASKRGRQIRYYLREACQPCSMGIVNKLSPKVGRFAAIALSKAAWDFVSLKS